MRVIAGSARSIPLIAPSGNNTRPTTDKIKETLFNILQYDVQGAVFYDIFAGSGAIGIEALSRGAERAVFVDTSRDAINCITANVKKCMFTASQLSAYFKKNEAENDAQLIIFMDPPYERDLEMPVLRAIAESGVLKEDDIIIVEEAIRYELELPEELGLEIYRVKEYKNQKHLFIRKR